MHPRSGITTVQALCTALFAGALLVESPAQDAAPHAVASVLTNVQSVVNLGREGARARSRTLDLEAVTTLPAWDRPTWLWVQDGTNALAVVHTNQFLRQAGLRVRVRGVAAAGTQAAVLVDSAQVEVLKSAELPEPLRLPVAHLFRPEFYGRWIEQEGVVRSVDQRSGQYRVVMNGDDAPVEALFYSVPGEPAPSDWLGRRVRMQGVCVTAFDAEGRVFGFELHVPGTNFVSEVLGSKRLSARPAPAQTMIVADSLAAALLETTNLTDPPQSPANATNLLPRLTTVQQVLDLGLEAARVRPHPVRVMGVITFPLANGRSLYMDDGTGGIEVVYGYTDRLPERPPGMLVWIDGIVGAGPIRPWIIEARIKPLGSVPLPEPKHPAPSELAGGKWHGHWIEIEGVVRDLTRTSTLGRRVSVGGHHLEIVVPYSGRLRPPFELAGARVLARGLCDVPVDFSGRPTQARLFLNDTNDLQVLQAGSADTFERALTSPASYREKTIVSDERIKIAGQVLFHSANGRIFLHDGTGAVQAEPLATLIRRSSRTVGIDRPPRERLQPGDLIELLGARTASAFAPKFFDAEYRRLDKGPAPEPVEVSAAEAASGRRDAGLVRLRARVVGRESSHLALAGQETLLLEEGGIVFEALCEGQGTNALPATPRNTMVQVSGICSTIAQTDGHLKNFRLLLRDASDVQVLGLAAPWQSVQPGRILAISCGLGALALGWVWLLRRQVRHRTVDLSRTNERLQREVGARRIVEQNLRASEARKTAVLETALDSIITIDREGRILDFNPAAEKTFGYARTEALGREMAELIIPPVMREMHRAGLKRAVQTGVDTMMGKRIEVPALRRNGEEFMVELALARIITDAGPIFTAHIQDISERKRAEAEMERALAHEKELSELKSRFVSMVSHEFRTPLGIIMSSAEILEAYLDRLPAEERHANLRDITQSSKHMAAMMEEVLLLGRVEAGKMSCRPAPLSLDVLCAKLADEVTSSTSARCRIELKTPPDLVEALADESLLRHILTNLLNNAVKYSPIGSTVEFSVEAQEHLAVFTVRDRGIGMSEADQRQLFHAFHRGRNVGETPGTGLGMVIVKHCVQLHGGKIAFESREGAGSSFVVALPLFQSGRAVPGDSTQLFRKITDASNLTSSP